MNFYRTPGVKELWASEVRSLSDLCNFCCMLDARNSNASWTMKFAIINKSPEPQDPSLKLSLTLKYCNFDYFHVSVVHIIYFLIFSWIELKGWSKRDCKNVCWLYRECYFWEDVACKPANLLRSSSTSFPFILTPACQWICENFAECFSSHFKENMAKSLVLTKSNFLYVHYVHFPHIPICKG